MKKATYILILSFVVLFCVTPLITQAAMGDLLTKGINIWHGAKCGGSVIPMDAGPQGPCDLCDAIVIASNILGYMFDLVLFVLTPVFIAYGAFTLMVSQGNPTSISKGKKILSSTVIGLVITLIAWLIINTLFHIVTGSSMNPWSNIGC